MAESILHFGAVRYRVNGTGTLHSELISLDDVYTQQLANLEMEDAPGKEPRILANFKQQRARLKVSTTELGDFMKFNRIIYFVKELWKDFPG